MKKLYYHIILSDLKPIKIGKKPGTTYCFGCKDYIKKF